LTNSENLERLEILSSKKELKPSAAVYPTPVALVTCVDEKGKPNIITLAAVGILCGNPPQVGISIRPSRYSNKLIRKSREFVVNLPTIAMVEETDYCGVVSGRTKDKFAETGLTPIEATKVKPPLIRQCPVNLECRVKDILSLGSHDFFVGEVVCMHADEEVLDSSGKIDFKKLNAITWNPISEEYYSLGKLLGTEAFSKRR
jgi:flavin reductase (DIM6/NTAB) family NADH-FMN oxidoreductase RutF